MKKGEIMENSPGFEMGGGGGGCISFHFTNGDNINSMCKGVGGFFG